METCAPAIRSRPSLGHGPELPTADMDSHTLIVSCLPAGPLNISLTYTNKGLDISKSGQSSFLLPLPARSFLAASEPPISITFQRILSCTFKSGERVLELSYLWKKPKGPFELVTLKGSVHDFYAASAWADTVSERAYSGEGSHPDCGRNPIDSYLIRTKAWPSSESDYQSARRLGTTLEYNSSSH